MAVSRRQVLIGSTLTAAAVGAYLFWPDISAAEGVRNIAAPEVFEMLSRNEIVLIDVRRPDEWQRTGIAQGALPIDLRRDDFVDAVRAAQDASGGKPVALICARGVRSVRMANRLTQAGISPLINVPEGMLGISQAPGWIKRGLPLEAWQAS